MNFALFYKIFGKQLLASALGVVGGALLLSTPQAAAQSNKQLLEEARRGDPVAMRRLGYRLNQGLSLKRDLRSAVGWWKKAAEKGDSRALVYLGDLHLKGEYYAENRKKAVELYREAANMGDEVAIQRLDKYAPKPKTTISKPQPAPKPTAEQKPEPPPEPEPEPPQAPHVSANNSITETTQAAQNIAHAARDNKIKRIVCLQSFPANGWKDDALAQKLYSQISRTIATRIDIQSSDEEEELTTNQPNTTAILVGEIFYSKDEPVGYITYRLYRADNRAIIAAGCHVVGWNDSEISQMSATEQEKLPPANEEKLEKMANLMSRLYSSHSLGLNPNKSLKGKSTPPLRLMYARLIPELLKKGLKLYEPETFDD